MNIDLTGTCALVTGGNTGIGKAIALALGDAGANVLVNYLSDDASADEVVELINAAGSDAFALKGDISKLNEVQTIFACIDERWGKLDNLVNNAGVEGQRELAWKLEPGNWQKVIDVNLNGTFNCSHEALKRMTRQGSGVIINITSVHEVIAWSGYSAYAATKAGTSMMTKTMAQEAAPKGVRVVAVAPGAIKTPINKQVWGDPDALDDLLEKIPLNRLGKPEEIATAAVFLASDKASYITGTTLFVDGAMTDYPGFAHGG